MQWARHITNHITTISGIIQPELHMGVGVSQLTMPKIKNKGAGASVNILYKIRMRYLAAEMGLAALKNWQQFF